MIYVYPYSYEVRPTLVFHHYLCLSSSQTQHLVTATPCSLGEALPAPRPRFCPSPMLLRREWLDRLEARLTVHVLPS